MPYIEPKIPCRFVEERVPFKESHINTFTKAGVRHPGDIETIFHGYDVPNASYQHVKDVVNSAEKFLNGWYNDPKILIEAEKKFPYVTESDPTAKWFGDALCLELFGTKDIKANVSQHLARWTGKRCIEFGSGVYMHTPSTCVDISEEALLRNPSKERLLCDLNTVGKTRKLPFENNSFDSAVMPVMMSYISDWKPFLNEVDRILKPESSSFIVLFENAGGTVIGEESISIFYQSGPKPQVGVYTEELEKLGYEHAVYSIPNNGGKETPFKIIEFADKIRQKRNIDIGMLPFLLERGMPVSKAFGCNVEEFYNIIKDEYGHDLCFVKHFSEIPTKTYQAERIEALAYQSLNPKLDMNKVDFDVTKEFKSYLKSKRGDVFFYPRVSRWEENVKKDAERAAKRIKELDQFVFSIDDVYVEAKSLAGKFEDIRREYFNRLINEVGPWNTFVGTRVKKEDHFGNSETEERFKEIYDNNILRRRVESSKSPLDAVLGLTKIVGRARIELATSTL